MDQAQRITENELEQILSHYKRGAAWSGNTLVSNLMIEVGESRAKKSGGEPVLRKVSEYNFPVMSGAEYEAKVNRYREKHGAAGEEPFEAQKPKGVYYPYEDNRMLAKSEKTGEPLLTMVHEMKDLQNVRVLKYMDQNGNEVPRKDALTTEYFTEKGLDKVMGRDNSRTEAQKDIPYEKTFLFKRVYLKNIHRIQIGGTLYEVAH